MYFSECPVGTFFRDESGNIWRKYNTIARRESLGTQTNSILMSKVGSSLPGVRGFMASTTVVSVLTPKQELDARQKTLAYFEGVFLDMGFGEPVAQATAAAVGVAA